MRFGSLASGCSRASLDDNRGMRAPRVNRRAKSWEGRVGSEGQKRSRGTLTDVKRSAIRSRGNAFESGILGRDPSRASGVVTEPASSCWYRNTEALGT